MLPAAAAGNQRERPRDQIRTFSFFQDPCPDARRWAAGGILLQVELQGSG